MITLSAGDSRATIVPRFGGRVASLRIGAIEVITGPDDEHGVPHDPLHWGIYPMVPFAGRIRDGRVLFRGRQHLLERRAPPHALHGTVDAVRWDVIDVSPMAVSMTCDLEPMWPFAGSVTHHITLSPTSMRFDLTVAAREAMPAQVGWHPWFARPAGVHASFSAWLPRDSGGIPTVSTTEHLPDLAGVVDDCFIGDTAVTVMTMGGALRLTSDCSHWVVYTGAAHGVCAEPQSGPPNAINDSPEVLEHGASLSRWFEISW